MNTDDDHGRDSSGRFTPGNSIGSKGRPQRQLLIDSPEGDRLVADVDSAEQRLDRLAASISAGELSGVEVDEALTLERLAWHSILARIRKLRREIA